MNAYRTIALAVACAGAASVAAYADTAAPPAEKTMHVYYGTVHAVRGTTVDVTLRTGRTLVVDAAAAMKAGHVVLLTPARPVIVRGTLEAGGTVDADAILRGHSMPEYWPADH